MFIYACARSLAKQKMLKYCLSDLSHLRFFTLASEDKNNQQKYLWFKIRNKLHFKKYKFEHYQDNRHNYAVKMLKETSGNVWYYGYFQGEQYLYGNHQDIINCFKIKLEYVKMYDAFKNNSLENVNTIVVHLRLNDYKTFGPDYLKGPDLTLPFNYYRKKLLKEIAQQGNTKFKIIFLSDDIKQVKQEFKDFDKYSPYYSEQNMIVDFQIIMHADTAIISASSYAWWAAWLNPKKHKKIVVPNYFLGFKVNTEYPIGIIPSTFIKSDVYEQ
jgi:hypothetical protein